MKAIVFLLCFVPSVAHAQFFQQPQPAQQPIIVYPQAPYAGGGNSGNSGDHTLLQILAMQQLFAQQTSVQQGWAASQDRQLQEILAHQEAFRSQMTQREWFDQVIRGQQREREAFGQRDILEQLRARQQPIPLPVPQPPRRRGLLGLRADVQNEVIYQNTGY